MAAEAFAFRPDRVEAVEDRLARFGRNAGALVVDADPDLVADPRRGDFDQPAGRREADRIVEDVVDRARQPVGLAHDRRRCPCAAGRRRSARRPFPRRVSQLPTSCSISGPRSTGSNCGAGKLGVGPRRFADVVDQPVEPTDVVAGDGHQLAA